MPKNLIHNISLAVHRLLLSRTKTWNKLIEISLHESEHVYDSRYGFLILAMTSSAGKHTFAEQAQRTDTYLSYTNISKTSSGTVIQLMTHEVTASLAIDTR